MKAEGNQAGQKQRSSSYDQTTRNHYWSLLVHALFSCDSEQAIQAIVFNGWVTYINRATGNQTTACIVSLHCEASRDGGVDAVAFDPDPIRGGKIVIQAKRYTNTVDVSAVRDLYGTVMAEGATKGIIVTTSGFGPDAHRFAKGKPLTLLDGNNLLYLLAKHGRLLGSIWQKLKSSGTL
ncbi:restriction endonuclease [Bradyrhizobium sp. AZCC 2230]|uniref:restriction endonuclease n=1 Tax=Bradyrhizobium sp. AZCC 2230 TaxID=3117021 RepID=UPI002FEFC1E3